MTTTDAPYIDTYDYLKYEVQTEVMDVTIRDLWKNQDTFSWYPDSQREFVWGLGKQMLFVDTIFRRIPVHSMLMMTSTDQNGRLIYEVTDGQQRQKTVIRFRDNKFPLMNEDQARAIMMRLPLISPGVYYDKLPLSMRNRFDDRKLHVVTYDKKDKTIVEEILWRTNQQAPFTVGEQLFGRSTRAKEVAIFLLEHPIWKKMYGGGMHRKEPFQAALNIIMVELYDKPVNLRMRGNTPMQKLIYGDFDSELSETFANTLWNYCTMIMHLFDGSYLMSKSDIIPVMQALRILEENGFDPMNSEKGCCTEWFAQAKRGPFLVHVEWNSNMGRLDFRKEQEDFWKANSDSLLKLPGLMRRF